MAVVDCRSDAWKCRFQDFGNAGALMLDTEFVRWPLRDHAADSSRSLLDMSHADMGFPSI